MSVTVFVWEPIPTVGHASILVGNTYVSWWPKKHALKEALKSTALHHRMSEDVEAEGRLPDYVSPPLKGLDEERMERWAKFILAHGPSGKLEFEAIEDYKLFSQNCAGLVVRALLIGSRRDGGILQYLGGFIPQPLDCEMIAKWISGENLTPDRMQRFGASLLRRAVG
jgi:hypothetical protein